MTLKLITPPIDEPVSLADAKIDGRIDGTDLDTLISAHITGGREYAENYTQRLLSTQTWELVLDGFPEAFVLRGPVQSVISVKYLDSDGAEQTLEPVDYLVDAESTPGYVTPAYSKSWPDSHAVPNAVRVRYVAGYGADIPKPIFSAILLHVRMSIEKMTPQEHDIYNRARHSLLDLYRVY